MLRWNWKAALYSSTIRATILFSMNLGAGLRWAFAAMMTEFVYRALAAGFYGAMTQAFRKVEPRWKGAFAAVAMMMTASHTLEFIIHWLRGTPNLGASIAASACFTLISTCSTYTRCGRACFSRTLTSARFSAT